MSELASALLAVLDAASPPEVARVARSCTAGATVFTVTNQGGSTGSTGITEKIEVGKNADHHPRPAQTETPAPRVYRFRLRGQAGDCTLIAGAWGPDEALEDLRERYGDRLVEVQEVAP